MLALASTDYSYNNTPLVPKISHNATKQNSVQFHEVFSITVIFQFPSMKAANVIEANADNSRQSKYKAQI